MADELLTTEEIAEYLKLNPQTVLRKAKRGEIPAFKVGRQFRFSREVIDQWLATRVATSLEVVGESQMRTRSGIVTLGYVPWGTHLCQFYRTKEDILEVVVPYFKAGLENREFCVWVTAPPLDKKEARSALRKQVPELDEHFKRGQMRIVSSSEFYTSGGAFVPERALKEVSLTHQQALEKGFRGTRRSGNTAWVEEKDWDAFVRYEKMLNDMVGHERMLALCSYSLDKCLPRDLIDILDNHRACLIKSNGDWNVKCDR